MLCWVAAEKADPTSNSNSNSKWLQRLRSNKGFPMGDELGLDHFLTQQNLHNPNPNPSPDHLDYSSHSAHHNSNGSSSSSSSSSYLLITGILSDLFNIAAPSNSNSNSKSKSKSINNKKFPRKQPNPKLFPIIPSPHSILLSDNSRSKPKPKILQEDDDDDKPDIELVGFSKSEVTVIDTSCDLWKSDKLIFRRNNVWKVKDKKGKSRTYGRKKRNHLHSVSHTTASPNNNSKFHRFHFTTQQLPPNQPFNNKEYTPQYCSGPEISANAPGSGNDKKENAYTVLPENGSYDTEKNGSM